MARKRRYHVVLGIFLMWCIITGSFWGVALANTDRTIIFGQDLTASQQQQVLNFFNLTSQDIDKEDIQVITVSNEEERKYLQNLVDEKLLGTKAISSASVVSLGKGQGIDCEIHNITWATEAMYVNSLATAGVKDAQIIVAAPFRVSGTAALTGIMKAFEINTGKVLSEEAKKAATQELVTTGELGQEIGDKEKATELIRRVKEQVVADKIKDPEQLRAIVRQAAQELNIELTDDQINDIIKLMQGIAQLPLDIKQIKEQLKTIQQQLDQVIQDNQEIKSVLTRILEAIQGLFARLAALLKK